MPCVGAMRYAWWCSVKPRRNHRVCCDHDNNVLQLWKSCALRGQMVTCARLHRSWCVADRDVVFSSSHANWIIMQHPHITAQFLWSCAPTQLSCHSHRCCMLVLRHRRGLLTVLNAAQPLHKSRPNTRAPACTRVLCTCHAFKCADAAN